MVISSLPLKYSEVLQTNNREKHMKTIEKHYKEKKNEIQINDKHAVKEIRNTQIITNEEA